MPRIIYGNQERERRRLPPERLFTFAEKRSLQGLSLAHTTFERVDFSRADLARSVFRVVSFVGCDFRGADLTFAIFHRCDLRGAVFDRSTILRGSHFEGSNLLGTAGLTRAGRTLVQTTGGLILAAVLD